MKTVTFRTIDVLIVMLIIVTCFYVLFLTIIDLRKAIVSQVPKDETPLLEALKIKDGFFVVS